MSTVVEIFDILAMFQEYIFNSKVLSRQYRNNWFNTDIYSSESIDNLKPNSSKAV